jgi:hypothetical protein
MKRILSTILCTAAGVAACTEAGALGALAEVTVIDRDTGASLETHYHAGEYWVAGRPGGRYAVEIHNRLTGRLLAVASVDGINVVSGETAGWDQTGYVFDPNQSYRITGWRKSDAEVAAFAFTAAPNSYAERTGRPANVGVIGVALFREKVPLTVTPAPPPVPLLQERGQSEGARSRSMAAAAGLSASASSAPVLADRKLGTAHGERESSYVGHTSFERLQPEPNEVIRIRYDSVDNLIAMGIIARPRQPPPQPNPFPDSAPRYVPDPPG